MAFDALMREEVLPANVAAAAYPSREEFAIVYRFLQKNRVFYGLDEELYLTLIETGINYCKLAIILEALRRSCLININKCCIKLTNAKTKNTIFFVLILLFFRIIYIPITNTIKTTILKI